MFRALQREFKKDCSEFVPFSCCQQRLVTPLQIESFNKVEVRKRDMEK